MLASWVKNRTRIKKKMIEILLMPEGLVINTEENS